MTTEPQFLRVWPGCHVAVHGTLNHVTGWILYEQGRWFESEMAMLPRLLEQGATFVDVGANIGVYSIAAAHFIGSSGRVVAFEPTAEARMLLEASARRNGFTQIILRSEALSDHVGQAELYFDTQTELASLSKATSGTTRSVSVQLNTLDAVHAEIGLSSTSLLKLDAEGAEEAIFRGGRAFLAATDPVILHEIKAGKQVDLRVARLLAELGFAPYRHLPGLDVLVPCKLGDFLDPYQLNLFAIGRARAAKLVERGVLAEQMGVVPSVPTERGTQRLSKFPYARHLSLRWQKSVSTDERLWQVFALHAFAHDETHVAAANRWAALERAFALALDRVNERDTVPRLLTATRLAAETGMRELAVRMVHDALSAMRSGATNLLDEPVLLPESAFETVRVAGPVDGLVLSAVLAAHERLRAYSSAYTGDDGLVELRLAALLGYSDGEMSRRLELLEQRAGQRSR